MESVGEYSNVGNGSSYDEYDGRLDSECWSLIKKIILPLLTIHKNTKNRYQLTDVEDLVKCFNHLSHLGFSRSEILSLITFKDRAFAQRMSDSGYKLNSQTGLFSRDSKKGSEDASEKSFKEPSQEKRFVLTSDTSDLSSSVVSSDKIKKTSPTPRLDNQLINSSINSNSNSDIIFSDLEKHLLEQKTILLEQKFYYLNNRRISLKRYVR